MVWCGHCQQSIKPSERALHDHRDQMANGPCTATTRRCAAGLDQTLETPRCCVEHNVRLLGDFIKWAERLGLGDKWWADYGLALGYGVSGGFYWNDKDTDVCIEEEYRDVLLDGMEEWKKETGYNVAYIWPGRERWSWGDVLKIRLSERNTINCDVTFWQRKEGMLDRRTWSPNDQFKGREMPVDMIFPLRKGTWEGLEINVPARLEDLLVLRYGVDWRSLPAVRHRPLVLGEAEHRLRLERAIGV